MMKMMKRMPFKLALGAMCLGSAAAYASFGHGSGGGTTDPTQPAVCDCRGGGGFPGPFDGANLKVELSDGDLYALQGRVVFLSEKGKTSAPYFEVDLHEHPWLANSRRKNYPYYPLLGEVSFWRGFEGQVVELSAQAQGDAQYDANTGTASYDIALIPIAVYVAPCAR